MCKFDLDVCGSTDICVSSIYMYAVRFIFVRFNLVFAVLKILSITEHHRKANRVFSRDVMAAMLVYPTNPPRIELYYHANIFFCFGGKTRLLIT